MSITKNIHFGNSSGVERDYETINCKTIKLKYSILKPDLFTLFYGKNNLF